MQADAAVAVAPRREHQTRYRLRHPEPEPEPEPGPQPQPQPQPQPGPETNLQLGHGQPGGHLGRAGPIAIELEPDLLGLKLEPAASIDPNSEAVLAGPASPAQHRSGLSREDAELHVRELEAQQHLFISLLNQDHYLNGGGDDGSNDAAPGTARAGRLNTDELSAKVRDVSIELAMLRCEHGLEARGSPEALTPLPTGPAALSVYENMTDAELQAVVDEVVSATVARVPVLAMLGEHDPEFLLRLALTLEPLSNCEYAYRSGWGSRTGLPPGSVVLARGQGATELIFVLSGSVEVEAPTVLPSSPSSAELKAGDPGANSDDGVAMSQSTNILIAAGGFFGGALNLPAANSERSGCGSPLKQLRSVCVSGTVGDADVAEWAELLVLTQTSLLEVARQFDGFEEVIRIWARQGRNAAVAACCAKGGNNGNGVLARLRSGGRLWKALAEQLPDGFMEAQRYGCVRI